ncbi:unnamed protein product [Rotaria sordida]|uniref:Uncharacterized protein n=1 Tax=Rotaria sordida TaxID=392033 RepID=A0A814VVZ6_9BILA|nr:unnamed protein product [Rotaria sordida]
MTDTSVDEVSPLIFHSAHIPNVPDNRTIFQRKLSVWLILLSAGFERLAFYSLAGNLVLFLTSDNIHWTPIHSVTASFIFLGTSYISALVFAWISDGKLGRAKTIIIGFILYIIGYVFISLFSDNNKYNLYSTFCGKVNLTSSITSEFFEEQCITQVLSTLVFTAIGVGAVQSNMAVFGAEQIREQRATRKYFDKYYAAINTGGLIAFAFIAYAQQNNSYFIGYIVPTVLLIIALILFLIGYKFYIHIQPHDSVISNFIPVFINAFQTWRKHQQNKQTLITSRRPSNSSTLSSYQIENSDQLSSTTSNQSWSFLDYAKIPNQGRFIDRIVDDIKSLRRKTNYTAADMSIFYQFPQYVGIGLSEVFTSVASLEFAYMAAPQSAQSLIMSLRFCSAGISSFFGSAYVGIFVKIKENLTFDNSECKAHDQPELFFIYFFVLAGFQFIFILIFLGCDRQFKLLKISKQRFNTRLFVAPNSRSSST